MSRRERLNVKVDAELVRKAKVVAAAKQITLSDYVSGLLREPIEADLGRVAAGLLRGSATAPGRETEPAPPGARPEAQEPAG
jgi:hypothetical protein